MGAWAQAGPESQAQATKVTSALGGKHHGSYRQYQHRIAEHSA